VEPIVDLAPGADDNALAVRFAELIRQNLRVKPQKQADFRALRAGVLVVAQDSGDAFTLRFDHGRLTVHDGALGIPTVTFCGDASALMLLADVPIMPWLRLPVRLPFRDEGREAYSRLALLLRTRQLKIYGLLAHPRTVTRLLRVLSVHG
jgi:hypothetical protein